MDNTPLKGTLSSVKYSRELTDQMTRGNNPTSRHDMTSLTALGLLKQSRVWIYNVSELRFVIDHPVLKRVKVPARKEDQEYAVVTSIPMVMPIPRDNVDANEVTYPLQDGRRLAMDLLCPGNLGLDQDADVPPTGNSNYLNSGVFWSTHNPPLKSEVKTAKKRMEKHYERLVRQAATYAIIYPADLKDNCGSNVLTPEHKVALDYVVEKYKL